MPSYRIYPRLLRHCVIFTIFGIFLISYVSFTTPNLSFVHLNFFPIHGHEELVLINQSSSTYKIEQTDSHPYLPIQIYTKNREKFFALQNKSKKLILLANSFFDDPTWGTKSLKTSSNTKNMSEHYCSFLNDHCEITNEITRFQQADAVVYHLRNSINRSEEIMQYRHPSQRFIFALWEPPVHTPDLHSFNEFFNWSMTYRFDSHIYAPYYLDLSYRSKSNLWFKNLTTDHRANEKKVVLYENINITRKIGTAAALISNCGGDSAKKRLSLIVELQQYTDVTIYGKCGQPCPTTSSNETIDCRAFLANNYYFFLAFENNHCHDYATEKIFNVLTLPIVPVVSGQANYSRYLPRSGFIDAGQFSSMADLGARLNQIRNNRTQYEEYFLWKKDFVWGGLTHFWTAFCDLCLRLHLDTTPNSIENIQQWWFQKTCQPETKGLL